MISAIDSTSVVLFGNQPQQLRDRSGGLDQNSEKSEEQSIGNALQNRSHSHSGNKEASAQKSDELTTEEKEQIKELKQRDATVKAHEMAHMAAAGSLAMGGPNYVYQTGPDGRSYAVGGDIQIDTSPGRTPEETVQKAEQMRAAALAPSDPSPQDLRVAAIASSMAAEAQSKFSKGGNDVSKNQPLTPEARSPIEGAISNSHRIPPLSRDETAGHDPQSGFEERDHSHRGLTQAAAVRYQQSANQNVKQETNLVAIA